MPTHNSKSLYISTTQSGDYYLYGQISYSDINNDDAYDLSIDSVEIEGHSSESDTSVINSSSITNIDPNTILPNGASLSVNITESVNNLVQSSPEIKYIKVAIYASNPVLGVDYYIFTDRVAIINNAEEDSEDYLSVDNDGWLTGCLGSTGAELDMKCFMLYRSNGTFVNELWFETDQSSAEMNDMPYIQDTSVIYLNLFTNYDFTYYGSGNYYITASTSTDGGMTENTITSNVFTYTASVEAPDFKLNLSDNLILTGYINNIDDVNYIRDWGYIWVDNVQYDLFGSVNGLFDYVSDYSNLDIDLKKVCSDFDITLTPGCSVKAEFDVYDSNDNTYELYSNSVAYTPIPSVILSLSDDLILTGSVSSNGNEDYEIDLHIFKDQDPSTITNDSTGNWCHYGSSYGYPDEDFEYFNNLLTNGIDLKNLDSLFSENYDGSLEIENGSTYTAAICFYQYNSSPTTPDPSAVVSNTVTYEHYVEPTCTNLKVTKTSDGRYILTGTLEVGSHNIEDMTIEEVLCGNNIGEETFYDYTASVASLTTSLSSGIDLTSIIRELGEGTYNISLSILDESSNNPNPDGTSAWGWHITFTVEDDVEYSAPSCTDLKVTYTDGKYIITGTLDVGSHNTEDMAIEDPLCGNDADETSFYDGTASVQSFKAALAEGIDVSDIVSVLGAGEYHVYFAILDDSTSNPNPDGKASWNFETSFTVQSNSKIELHFDATTGTITGKVTLTDDGYTLEDVGSIRKCKSGNTIDLQNDEYITEVLYFTDFSNITAINSALATGITASSEHPSILAAIEENGTGYYYVDWYLINNDTYNDKTFTSEPSYYEAQNDDEHIEPSGSLTVITSNGIYTLSGSIDAGSHTKLTVEDYINISSSDGSIDIVLDDVDIETGTPAYPTLSINIDITKYLEGHPSDTYTASISVIDNPEDLSYHDEEYGDTFSTTFEYVGEDSEVPSMTLVLDVVNGKVTGSVSSLGEGYTEDEGSIYKCSNGSTINKQNDTWIGAIFTDSKYWTDNAADLDSLLKVGTTSIMTDNGTTSISEALAENGTGYYYVCWYITRDEGTSSSDGYGFQYSPVVYYEAQNDDEDYIEPSGSLTVTNNNGTYMLSGSIDAGSHTELTVEDYITISLSDGSVDIVLDDVGIETGTSASPSLSINIDITDYLSGYPNGTYIASISLIDETDSNPNPDGEYSWTFDTSFTIADDEEPSEESSISLQLNVDTGTITGSINLGDDGYELEDTGLIYKCKTGSTIDPADSMDATDDIWVGEVFNFSDYADIVTINNALSAGITQDIDGVSILDLISKSGTGYYYVRWYLINPNNTNDSRYFYSPVSYYKAEEPYQPKLNFINPTLKSLWQRLVNATDKLCGVSSSGSWQVILTSGEKDSNCYPYVEGNMLYSNGDPWKMEEVDQGTVWSFYPSEPLDISGFNTLGNYHIYSPMGATGDYRLVYQSSTSSTRSVGMKPIHDALLNHFGISHNTTPIIPGDYMKGIAVAARYYVQQTIDTTSRHTLSQIVYMLENRAMPDIECNHSYGNITYTPDSDGITHMCVCEDCDAIWYESCQDSGADNPGYCVCGRYISDMPTLYYCPVCNKPFTSADEALNCDDTENCPGNNPGWGHVCERCGGDHYEEDCPYRNMYYCEYCNTWYEVGCQCTTDWCTRCSAWTQHSPDGLCTSCGRY